MYRAGSPWVAAARSGIGYLLYVILPLDWSPGNKVFWSGRACLLVMVVSMP